MTVALVAPASWPRAGLGNGPMKERPVGVAGFGNGPSVGPAGLAGSDPEDAAAVAALDGVVGGAGAVRRGARALHAACAELLPGYSAASREPWRQALLTAGCLDPHPRRAPAGRFAPPLVVEDVVQPSDVLCALWLARRSGLFFPGSRCGDGVGLRSACEIVPSFAPSLPVERRAELLEALRANTAWRAHRLARAGAAAPAA